MSIQSRSINTRFTAHENVPSNASAFLPSAITEFRFLDWYEICFGSINSSITSKHSVKELWGESLNAINIILQAMIDVVAERGWLATTLRIQQIMQSIIQARWYDDPVVLTLPHVEHYNYTVFNKIQHNYPVFTLPGLKELCIKNYEVLAGPLREEFSEPEIEQIYQVSVLEFCKLVVSNNINFIHRLFVICQR